MFFFPVMPFFAKCKWKTMNQRNYPKAKFTDQRIVRLVSRSECAETGASDFQSL